MIRNIICLGLTLLGGVSLSAQRLAIGEKVPEVRIAAWHGGNAPSDINRPMVIDFFHSDSEECVVSLSKMESIHKKFGSAVNVIVLSREPLETIAPVITGYGFYTGYDEGGKLFGGYNVRYVPFAVVADSRGRLIWMGNTNRLTDDIIEKALE